MISEKICLDVLSFVNGQLVNTTHQLHLDTPTEPNNQTKEAASTIAGLYRHLLKFYTLGDIDAAVRWLELGSYMGRTWPFGMSGPYYHQLEELGKAVATTGRFPDEEKELFYRQEDPHGVFIAHQFMPDDESLVRYIEKRVLNPIGLKLVSGRVDGLEEFRHTILKKIRECRFFLCLLTRRVELPSGQYASSTWLYQETGAALAYGKKPLLLVEEGIDSHYVGEFQKVYEHISFNRSNHPDAFEAIQRRFINDLEANNIPLPSPLT